MHLETTSSAFLDALPLLLPMMISSCREEMLHLHQKFMKWQAGFPFRWRGGGRGGGAGAWRSGGAGGGGKVGKDAKGPLY